MRKRSAARPFLQLKLKFGNGFRMTPRQTACRGQPQARLHSRQHGAVASHAEQTSERSVSACGGSFWSRGVQEACCQFHENRARRPALSLPHSPRAKLPAAAAFTVCEILIASLPDAQGEPVAVKLLFRSIKVGRDEVAVRALARPHACDAHLGEVRQVLRFATRNFNSGSKFIALTRPRQLKKSASAKVPFRLFDFAESLLTGCRDLHPGT